MALTREQILAARSRRKPIPLEVPEWGGTVYIKVLSAGDQVEMSSNGHKDAELPVWLLAGCLVSEDGERLFTDEDVPGLLEEEFPIIMRVFSEAARHNGLSTKELDEAMQSFGTTQADDSSSA